MSLLSSEDDEDMRVVDKNSSKPKSPPKNGKATESEEKLEDPNRTPELNFGDVTDEEQEYVNQPSFNCTQLEGEKKVFDNKTFYLNFDLPATDKIKFERYINFLRG